MFPKIINTISKHAGALLALWWILSFTATHMPLPEETGGVPYADKAVHVLIYTGLAFLLSLWWSKYTPVKGKQTVIIFLLLLIYAFLDEATQAFVGRNPDIMDIAANTVGIAGGLAVFFQIEKFNRQ